jgi:hypothetical protein
VLYPTQVSLETLVPCLLNVLSVQTREEALAQSAGTGSENIGVSWGRHAVELGVARMTALGLDGRDPFAATCTGTINTGTTNTGITNSTGVHAGAGAGGVRSAAKESFVTFSRHVVSGTGNSISTVNDTSARNTTVKIGF